MNQLSGRKKYLDFLRLLALYYMIFQHGVLGLLTLEGNNGIIRFLFELVPLCPALFLFLAGYSLTISYYRRRDRYREFIGHVLIRGGILCVCAMILFIAEHGFQLPDFFIAPGILNTIGYLLLTGAVIVGIKGNKIITGCLIVLFSVIYYILEKYTINIVPFNNGYEPLFPTIIFGYIGLLSGLILEDDRRSVKVKNIIIIISGIIGVGIFTYYSIRYGLFKIFYPGIGRGEVSRLFNANLFINTIVQRNADEVSVYYATIWNFNTAGLIANSGCVFILFAVTHFLEPFMRKYLPKNVFLPGKFAFFNYFYHLAVIGLLIVIFGYNTFNVPLFLLFLALIFGTGYLFPYIYLRIKNRAKRDS